MKKVLFIIIIMICEKCEYAENSELNNFKAGDSCPKCGGLMMEKK